MLSPMFTLNSTSFPTICGVANSTSISDSARAISNVVEFEWPTYSSSPGYVTVNECNPPEMLFNVNVAMPLVSGFTEYDLPSIVIVTFSVTS